MTRQYVDTDVYTALKRLVSVLGGAMSVGKRLRPDRSDEQAQTWLLDCLNPDRAAELHPTQVLLLLRWACEDGFHEVKHWMDCDTGYAPTPPLSHAAVLAEALKEAKRKQREAEESARSLRDLCNRPELLAAMKHAGLKIDA